MSMTSFFNKKEITPGSLLMKDCDFLFIVSINVDESSTHYNCLAIDCVGLFNAQLEIFFLTTYEIL